MLKFCSISAAASCLATKHSPFALELFRIPKCAITPCLEKIRQKMTVLPSAAKNLKFGKFAAFVANSLFWDLLIEPMA